MYLKTIRYKRFDSIELKESLFNEYKLPDHFHETYCIGLLSQGIKQTKVEGNHSIIPANHACIVNPYQIHSDQNFDQDASLYRMIYVNSDVVKFIAKKYFASTGQKICFTNELISDPFVSIAILNFFNDVSNENGLEQKLRVLIEILLNNYLAKTATEVKQYHQAQSALLETLNYARSNFSNKIDITKMASACKLSKYQFIRYFKKLTGITPATYIIICRMNHAKSLVLKGIPIGQAALEAGFYDHAQYCKFFKYYTGLSPQQYQRSCNIIQAENCN
jgi:AraC-like DNA-binding protein